MSDLVERLNDLAGQRHRDRGLDAVDDALREAASRISQQDAELERLRRELEEAKEFRAILEGHLSAAIDDYNEARKAAFIEAAEIADEAAAGYSHLRELARKAEDAPDAFVHLSEATAAKTIAAALRAKAEGGNHG